MSLVKKMALQKMQRAYEDSFERLLEWAPQFELTRASALDPDYIRRLFARIEIHGMDEANLDALHFKITAAALGIPNNIFGWRAFLTGDKPQAGKALF